MRHVGRLGLCLVAAFAMSVVAAAPAAAASSGVTAWGYNNFGELGDGTSSGPETCASNFPCSKIPVAVTLPSRAMAVSAGAEHSLALLGNGKVMAWGQNEVGQLGDGGGGLPNELSDVPVAVSLPSVDRVTAVSAGGEHSLALLSDGRVMAWGLNEDGQLGDGNSAGPESCEPVGYGIQTACSRTPVEVTGLSGVKAVSAGLWHSLALLDNGTVMAWGINDTGQLGDDSTDGSDVPVQVSLNLPPGVTVTAISAGDTFSLALLSNGTVMAWGFDIYGALGDGTSGGISDEPVAVCAAGATAPCSEQHDNVLTGVTAVSAGSAYSLALLSDGTAMAWGEDKYGQLGDGNSNDTDVPVEVSMPSGVTVKAVSAGRLKSLAVLGDGTVMDWGTGLLGNGTEAGSDVPVAVSGASGITAVSAGATQALAIGTSASAMSYCAAAWGEGFVGQLGDGGLSSTDGPVAVSLSQSSGVTAVSGGWDHSLALLSPGTVMAWGYNVYGQLGDGSTTTSDVPVAVSLPSLPPGVTVKAVSAGGEHSLALLSDGKVIAWGDNEEGELGNGTTVSSKVPVEVKGLSGVKAVSAGAYHSLALLDNGKVMAWGGNADGQLGDGVTGGATDSDVPVEVSLPSGVTATEVSAGEYYSLTLLSDGTVMAWGFNGYGELGNGSTTNSDVPVAVSGLRGVTAVSAGWHHSLALLSNGTVVAWGYNDYGQLGDDAMGPSANSDVPVDVSLPLLSGITVKAISAGGNHSLALLGNGTVMAWGYNGNGELGDDTTTNSDVPVAVSGLGEWVTAVSAGSFHSLAICEVPPVSIRSTTLRSGVVGGAYSQTLTATGGTTPYTWSLLAGSLPPGLSLNPASGAVTGTPTTAGVSSFTVEVTDSSAPTPQTATANLSITVQAGKVLELSTKGTGALAASAELSASSSNLLYTTSAGALECSNNILTGVLNNNGSTKDKGDINGALSTGEESSESCKTSTLGPASVEWAGFKWPMEFTDKGTISIKGSKAVGFKAKFLALEDVTCTFEAKKLAGTFNTKGSVTMTMTGQTFKGAKGNAGQCAKSGKLSGTFNLSSGGEAVEAEL